MLTGEEHELTFVFPEGWGVALEPLFDPDCWDCESSKTSFKSHSMNFESASSGLCENQSPIILLTPSGRSHNGICSNSNFFKTRLMVLQPLIGTMQTTQELELSLVVPIITTAVKPSNCKELTAHA